MQFSAFLSCMLWHIELTFCIWLCVTVLQIKFECHQFSSIFVGVMPLLGLRILKIHSFPHFSLTCFDILSWTFAFDLGFFFTTDQVRLSLICIIFCGSYAPFGMWNTGNTVFCTYLLCALTYGAESLHMTSFNVLKIKFWCHNSVSVWLFVRPSIFCTFLLH